jgi:hypothetical protein
MTEMFGDSFIHWILLNSKQTGCDDGSWTELAKSGFIAWLLWTW